MSGIAEQLLFNRWKELDKVTWNKDPEDSRYTKLYAEQDEIEQELRKKHKLAIAWTMEKRYRLVEASKAEPVKLEPKKRTPVTRYKNRYSQKKMRDAGGVPYWLVVDKKLVEADQGPFYRENDAANLAERLNNAERAKHARPKVRLEFGQGRKLA